MPATDSSAEALRLQYLHAMGITSYFPRMPLPGALPSPVCEFIAADNIPQDLPEAEVATKEQAKKQVTKAANPAPANRPDRAEPERAPATSDGDKSPEAARRMTSAPAAADASAALHFQLLLIQVDDDLAVLSQVPALAPPHLQHPQQQLLANLLRWLGKTLPDNVGPRVFRWPLPGVTLTNNRQEAGTSLSHFVEQASIEQAFRYLLLLGEQAAECLQDHHRPGPSGSPSGRVSSWQLHATHSLDEMLALPQLKREVWQTLLPLHATLHMLPANKNP